MKGEAGAQGRKPKAAPVSGSTLLHQGLASTVLGFPLALALSGILNHFLGSGQDSAQYQVVMWSVAPFWAAVISVSFLAPDRKTCWLWLLAANAVAALALAVVR